MQPYGFHRLVLPAFFRQRRPSLGFNQSSDGTIMNCWVPKSHKPYKPTLLLLHGFGANAMWQYGEHLRHFTPHFNVYVPDLLFFGHSYTSCVERSESFQAQCVIRLMEAHGVGKMSIVGISYGGFVAYNVALQCPGMVERVALCCAGVCLEAKDMEEGLFRVSNLDEAASILLPQTPEKLKELMRYSFFKPAKTVPSFFLTDFIHVMCTDYVEEKRDLIRAILMERKMFNLPKITQPTLIIWGQQDQIFPVELGYRLKREKCSTGDYQERRTCCEPGKAQGVCEAPESLLL
ncbi:alpha/beta-Hydrolases superfamily protein [Prunus dulcis]|uniref:Alpha/beta-Hydrolases superfamily protein n=1 Tax=Prunus dulcis TaxID=3755 RepID=A0A5H2XRZ0_PRUDU|nr:alpha/beta-Hydrolases superfamily protein [Prunus dulcis]